MNKKSIISLYIVIISILLSIVSHIYLTHIYYQLKLGLASGENICNINITFNCDSVGASPFADIWGIPLGLLAALTNLTLLIFIIIYLFRLSKDYDLLGKFIFLISFFIFFMSIIMGSISLFILKIFCIFCIICYILSFIIIIALYIALPKPLMLTLSEIKSLFTKNFWMILSLLFVPFFSWIGNQMILDSHGFKDLNNIIKTSIFDWKNAPKNEFNLKNGLIIGKAENPNMVIVDVFSFLCPHCKNAIPSLHAFVSSHQDVLFIAKPIGCFEKEDDYNNKNDDNDDDDDDNAKNNDKDNNDSKKNNENENPSCLLAKASLCAQLKGSGWSVHDWIFKNQKIWTKSLEENKKHLKNMAKNLKIDWNSLNQCIDSNKEIAEAAYDITEEAKDANVYGVPTIFINGKKLKTGQFLPILNQVYDIIKKNN